MKLEKKNLRTLAYVGIIGFLGIASLTLFTVSRFEKAKYQASSSVQLAADNKLNQLIRADSNALTDESSRYYAAAIYWDEVKTTFEGITKANSQAYQATAIPAYILSLSTLVAVGLILKHAEKAKEKEDNAV